MLESYADVIEAAGKPPVWWDVHGGPHYCEPGACRTHARDAWAMRRLRCQECTRLFRVCLVGPYATLYDRDRTELNYVASPAILPPSAPTGATHGDLRAMAKYAPRLDAGGAERLGLDEETAAKVASAMTWKHWVAADFVAVPQEPDPRHAGSTRDRIPDDWHYGDPPFHGSGILGPEDTCGAGYCMNSIPEWEWEEFWPGCLSDPDALYLPRGPRG
jgi:hypothetical protein